LNFRERQVAAPVQNAAEIDAALAKLAREPSAGVMAVPDIWLAANRGPLVGLAAKHGLPAIYPSRLYITDVGLMSYGPDTPDFFRRAAAYVDRIWRCRGRLALTWSHFHGLAQP
jgi:hypothetical protein